MTTTIRNVRTSSGGVTTTEAVDVEFDEHITTVRPAGTVAPAGGPVVDGTGQFLVPGLIDTHVHLGSPAALSSAVRAGVTTMVDLGTHPDSLVDEQRGAPGAPGLLSAGSAASAPGSAQIARMGFPDASGVSSAADAERYLDWRAANGSDLVKIIIEDPDATDVPALDVATITALVDGARRRGLRTVAHVVTAASFVRGLDTGVDILTHAPLDRPLPGETVRRMVDQGTIASPTLVMMRAMARARLGDRADAAFENAVESVRRMHTAGVPVVAGTDANETPFAPVRHGEALHEEMLLLRDTGMTNGAVLTAATDGAAAAFGLHDRGRVEVGLRADLLLTTGDPLVDPAVLAQPGAVWVGGTLIS
ncbi:amidohydrolase family protein [Sphingomonas sp. LR61]|uniref:amidohydrolase family protein n=1 Tax=Bacteria TaxID=2 RepID=UPI00135CBA45|nr:amidohydrolase family protein [Curtobacterium sp. 18060]